MNKCVICGKDYQIYGIDGFCDDFIAEINNLTEWGGTMRKKIEEEKQKIEEKKLSESIKELEGLFMDLKKKVKSEEVIPEPATIPLVKEEPIEEESHIVTDEPIEEFNEVQPKKEMTYKDDNETVLKRNTMTPVSEIKLNNQLLTKLVYLGWAVLVYIMAMTAYIIYTDSFNNTIRAFTGCWNNLK